MSICQICGRSNAARKDLEFFPIGPFAALNGREVKLCYDCANDAGLAGGRGGKRTTPHVTEILKRQKTVAWEEYIS